MNMSVGILFSAFKCWSIFIKFGMNVMLLEVIPIS
jgi:uncharacterized membrane protein